MSQDIVIVGAGIIGLSIAYQVARRSRLRILVLEKGRGVGEGSTGASSAMLRHRYSLEQTVLLARDGIEAYRNWAAFTALSRPRAKMHQDGVLWMPGDDGQWAQREQQRLAGLGIDSEVLEDEELQRRYPALSACCLAPDIDEGRAHDCCGGGRALLETSAGYIEPVDCAEDLLEACRRDGVELRFGQRVAAIRQRAGQVTGVSMADGSSIDAPQVVNAAGPWCMELLHGLGLELPWSLVPTRIQVLHLDLPASLARPLPACADIAGGIYFRPQNRGQQLVLGSVRAEDEREAVSDPDAFERQADDAFAAATLHALHHRIPSLPYRGAVRSYCGLYTINHQDCHPLVGESDIRGLFLANGFSGHGFKLAPAIGSLLAQTLSGERLASDTAVSADFLAPGRAPLRVDALNVLA